MKRKSDPLLGTIAAIVSAGLIEVSPMQQTVNNSQGTENNVNTNTSKKEAPPLQQQQSNIIQAPVVAGERIGGAWDMGIPPHIYGTRYVRRGTHKKTNV